MVNMLAIAFGAAVGANLRYGLSIWAAARFGTTFPYGTLIINLLGCLGIGIVLSLAASRLSLHEPVRLLIVTGLLGGFTTFSTFGYESYSLITTGNWLAALIYMTGSVIIGLCAVFLGVGLVRFVSG